MFCTAEIKKNKVNTVDCRSSLEKIDSVNTTVLSLENVNMKNNVHKRITETAKIEKNNN